MWWYIGTLLPVGMWEAKIPNDLSEPAKKIARQNAEDPA